MSCTSDLGYKWGILEKFHTVTMDIDQGVRLTEFAPLLWFQGKMLSQTLKSYPYAQQEIWSTLAGIKFQFNPKKDILENCRGGGCLSYNALV